MANPKPPPDPTRATILGEDPPPSAVPSAIPMPPNDRPVRPVLRPVGPSITPGTAAFPPEMIVDLSRRTMVPEEEFVGAPPIPAALVNARTLGLGPAKVTNVPPQPPPVLQKVALRITTRNVPDAKAESWIQSPTPLGKPVAVNSRLVAVFIAARVTNFFPGAEPGTMIVEVDLAFAPMTPGKVAEDWALRYAQNDAELQKSLTAALYMAFSRLPLWPGLIVRFVGGPPMTQADADANRYHVWIDEARSPTRVEIDDRFVEAAREQAESAYLKAEGGLFTRLTLMWWEWKNPLRLRDYRMGKLLAERDDLLELDKKELEALKTALAAYAGPVISSQSAVAFGDDLDVRAMMEAKGRQGVRPTEIERPEPPRRPTYLEHEPLPDGAMVPLPDGEG